MKISSGVMVGTWTLGRHDYQTRMVQMKPETRVTVIREVDHRSQGDAVKSGTHRGTLKHKYGNGDLGSSLQEAANRNWWNQSNKQELELVDTLVDPQQFSERDDGSKASKNPSILVNFGRTTS